MTFELHSQLEADCLFIKDLSLSRLLLMNDKRVPWFILVPRKPNMTEIYHLNFEDQIQLLKEINEISMWVQDFFKADKMNIAALGNMVPQLHIHIIGRRKNDFAWPKPIWGLGTAVSYSDSEAEFIINKLK